MPPKKDKKNAVKIEEEESQKSDIEVEIPDVSNIVLTPEAPKKSRHEEKLSDLVNILQHRFVGLNEYIDGNNVIKRARYEKKFRLAEEELERIGKLLSRETSIRVRETREFQSRFENSVSIWKNELEAKFHPKLDAILEELEAADKKVTALQTRIDENREKLIQHIEQDATVILKKLKRFEIYFDTKNGERTEQESKIEARLAEAEKKYSDLFEVNRNELQNQLDHALDGLPEMEISRKIQIAAHHQRLKSTIKEFWEQVAAENKDRIERRDQLLCAIPEYTKKLQGGINLLEE